MNSIKIDEALGCIGIRVKRRRLKEGLTQKELAKLAGIAETTVVAIERGNAKPNQFVLFKLSRAFGITIDDLVYKNVYL